jgi:2-polyprenyl-3-methyl-5-hydroxy-6-metoxy-1,4-benzoquinol methylase
MGLLSALKRLPIDLGQGNLRETTKGKLIAMDAVPAAKPAATALDVGCREGAQTRWLRQRGYSVVSIDVAPEMDGAIVVNVEKGLPFADSSFDLIWCSEVIEHLEDPSYAIAEFRRVLRPGGLMMITTPNSFFWLFRLLALLGLSAKSLQHPGHKHFFSYTDIRALFPHGTIHGFFPYAVFKLTISRGVGLLSPTFVIIDPPNDNP